MTLERHPPAAAERPLRTERTTQITTTAPMTTTAPTSHQSQVGAGLGTWLEAGELLGVTAGAGAVSVWVTDGAAVGVTTDGCVVGTGLGLAVSQKILREHGGDITVETKPGFGCRFVLNWPRVDEEHRGGEHPTMV